MSETIANLWLARQDAVKVAQVTQEMLARSRSGPTDYMRYAGGDEGFATWLYLADRRCTRMVGVGIFDIADWNWRDAYDDGVPPSPNEALRADDTFGSLFSGSTAEGGEQ